MSKTEQIIERIEADIEINPEGLSATEWLIQKRAEDYGSGAAQQIEKLLGLGKNAAYRLFKALEVGTIKKERSWNKPGNFFGNRRQNPKLQEIHRLIKMARQGDRDAKKRLWSDYKTRYYNYAEGDVSR